MLVKAGTQTQNISRMFLLTLIFVDVNFFGGFGGGLQRDQLPFGEIRENLEKFGKS